MPVVGGITSLVPVGPPAVVPGAAHAPDALLVPPPSPAAAPAGAAAHGFVAAEPVPLILAGPVVLPASAASVGWVSVGTVDRATPSAGVMSVAMPSAPPVPAPAGAAHEPEALLLAPPPTPTASPVGAAAHGVTEPLPPAVASASRPLAAPSARTSVGAVATGAVVTAAPPSGAAESA